MNKNVLKPERSEAGYQGFYSEFAFKLLANPIPLYQNSLKYLGKFGANLNSLRADLVSISEANVNCFLQDLSVFVAYRLDRLDVTFPKLHEVGADSVGQILTGAWAVIHDTDKTISAARHAVTANVYSQIVGAAVYDEVLSQFLTTPKEIRRTAQVGAVFYLNDTKGQGSIMLDRVPGQKQGMLIKLSVTFDAKRVAIDELPHQAESYLTRHLNTLGLELEREVG